MYVVRGVIGRSEARYAMISKQLRTQNTQLYVLITRKQFDFKCNTSADDMKLNQFNHIALSHISHDAPAITLGVNLS